MEPPFMKVSVLLILKNKEFYNSGRMISKSLMANNYFQLNYSLYYTNKY